MDHYNHFFFHSETLIINVFEEIIQYTSSLLASMDLYIFSLWKDNKYYSRSSEEKYGA